MKLKDLMDVLPGYVLVHVHDYGGELARYGTPNDFIDGVYSHLGELAVLRVVPLGPYHFEVTVEKNKEDDL